MCRCGVQLADRLDIMRIISREPIIGLDGKHVGDDTIGSCICNALMAMFPHETELPGTEKLRRYKLALRIYDAALPVNVSVEDATLIKQLVGFAYGPLVVGQVWGMIDGSDVVQTKVCAL